MDSSDTIVVGFSGGKDSTALLNVTLDVAEERNYGPVKAIFFDEECMHPETIEYVQRVREDPRVDLTWSCIPIKSRNASSRLHPYYLTFDPDPAIVPLWARQPPEGAFTSETHPTVPQLTPMDQMGHLFPVSECGSVCHMLGRRCQESVTRWRMISNRGGKDAFISKSHMSRWKHIRVADPIYDWRTQDVWVAPHLYGWDYNRTYDIYARMGVPLHAQRVAPAYAEESKLLWAYAIGWPDLWDKIQMRVPGAACFARYNKTKLYRGGLAGSCEPSEGESWQDYVQRLLMLWGPDTRKQVAANIVQLINRHDRRCMQEQGFVDGIPEMERHILSGVSWKILAKVAFQGMLKGRTLSQLMQYRGKIEKVEITTNESEGSDANGE